MFANGVAYRYPDVPAWSGFLGSKRDLDRVLHPLMHGSLAYTGMRVLDPFVAYAADSVDDATRAGYLADLEARLRALR